MLIVKNLKMIENIKEAEKNVTQNDDTWRQSLLTFWDISFQR